MLGHIKSSKLERSFETEESQHRLKTSSSSDSKSECRNILFKLGRFVFAPPSPQQQQHATRFYVISGSSPTSFATENMMSFSPSTPLQNPKRNSLSFDPSASPLFSPSAAARYAQQADQWNQVTPSIMR